jgi:hypothetical protein
VGVEPRGEVGGGKVAGYEISMRVDEGGKEKGKTAIGPAEEGSREEHRLWYQYQSDCWMVSVVHQRKIPEFVPSKEFHVQLSNFVGFKKNL